ncbi:2'-5' RNA ligase family protein [Candidatus Kaiserbacteria bacterium]|nr:2'-5' RNA ligase family protein [Candidatus Kaiserbacteria bacterium]
MSNSLLPQEIFIAFDVPHEARVFYARVQEEMARAGMKARKHRTIPHITVKAPMVVSSAQVHEVRDMIQDLITSGKMSRFAVELGEIGMFNKSGAIYLVVDGGAIRPQMFYIIDRLTAIGYGRKFYEGLVPHITLAKPDKWHRSQAHTIIMGLEGRPRGRYSIDAIHLFTRNGCRIGEWDQHEILRLR